MISSADEIAILEMKIQQLEQRVSHLNLIIEKQGEVIKTYEQLCKDLKKPS